MLDTRSTASGAASVAARPRFGWIYGAPADLAIALCWIPIFALGHALTRSAGNDHILNGLFNGAFVLSLLHQPLTLALVYGDKDQFALRRKLFTWSPIVAVALIATAILLHLWIIIPVAAVWNTIHTLQQRYGLSRIYARKAGYGSGRLDRMVLYSWMGAALVIVGSTSATLRQLARIMLDDTNAQAVRTLAGVRPYALWLLIPAVGFAVSVAARLVRQEHRHLAEANRSKWVYQASSLLLIAAIAFDPLAGFIAYVAAHAIEYFIVVYKTMQSRYGKLPVASTFLGRVAHRTSGRIAFLIGFLFLFYLLDARLTTVLPSQAYLIALYSVGILHFWYDSFIWKLRKPAVAANFGIKAPDALAGRPST